MTHRIPNVIKVVPLVHRRIGSGSLRTGWLTAMLLLLSTLMSGPVWAFQRSDEPDLDALISRLADPDEEKRIDAISDITFLRYEQNIKPAIPVFEKMLSDDSFAVRLEAAEALIELDQPVDQLLATALEGLDHTNPEFRISSAYLMRRFGHRAAPGIATIVKVMEDDESEVRGLAAQILGRIGPDQKAKSIPPLIKALDDEHPNVRLNAAEALADVDGPLDRSLDVLVKTLEAATGEDKPDFGIGSIGHDTAEVIGQLGVDGAEGVGALTKAIDKGGIFRQTIVATALGEIGPPAKPAIEALGRALRNGEAQGMPFVHRSWCASDDAATALVRIGADSVPVLLAALNDPDGRVRANAANALGDIASEAMRVVPELTQRLTDKDPTVRAHAAWALGKFGREANPALLPLVRILFENTEWDSAPAGGGIAQSFSVPWHAVEAISRIKPAAHELVEALQVAITEEASINYAVATTIASIGPDAKPLIEPLKSFLDQPSFQADAAFAIVSIDPNVEGLQVALERSLINDGPASEGGKINRVAARGLGRMGDLARSSIPRLEEAIDVAGQSEFVGGASDIIVCSLAILKMDATNTRAAQTLLKEFVWTHAGFDGDAIVEAVEAMPAIAKKQAFLRTRLIKQLEFQLEDPPKEWDEEDIASASRQMRLRSAKILLAAKIATPKTLTALIKLVDKGRGSTFRAAAELLQQFGPDAAGAVDVLVEDLDDFSRYSQGGDFYGNGGQLYTPSEIAVDTLAAIGKPAIAAVVKKMKEPYHKTRAAAAETLGRIGVGTGPTVVSLMQAATDNSHLVRLEALKALGNIRVDDPETRTRVLEVLNRASQDPRPSVRQSAVAALGEFSR